jgi:F0F1-type ATP synthase assembly protein I
MGAVFLVLGLIAAIWSIVRYQIVYNSLRESFPTQFQDPLTSRYAFPVIVLSHSTPLSLQADYVKSLAGGCVAFLGISLSFFSFQQTIFGCLCLIGLFLNVVSTIRSWNTYRENSNRSTAHDDEQEP